MAIREDIALTGPPREVRLPFRGSDLLVLEWGPSRGPLVIALHGYIDHAWSWDGFVPHLGGEVRFISLSARGHAGSGRADAYGWADFVVDAAHVVERFADRDTHILGHSWGAHIALAVAHLMPERIRSVVNVDGIVPGDKDFERPLDLAERVTHSTEVAIGRPSLRRYSTREEMIVRRAKLTPRVPARFVRSFVENGSLRDEAGWHWAIDPLLLGPRPWAGPFGGIGDVETAMGELPVPLLIVTGDVVESPALTPDRSAAYRVAEHRHVTHVPLEATGHYVHLERPDDLAHLVTDFVS